MAATVIVLLLQTSQDSGEGHWCPPNCVWMDQRCVCAVPDKDNEEPPISPPIPAEVILLFFVNVRDSMTWLLLRAKSYTLAVCLECLQTILGSNFQKRHMCVTFGKHDVVIAIMKYQ